MSLTASIAVIILPLFLMYGDIIFSHRGIISEARAQDDYQRELPKGIVFEGGGGESADAAIIIKGARDIVVGLAAEYYYLEMKYGRQNVKWQLISQNLLHQHDRHFDWLKIRFADGSQKEIFFDITEFFDKM
jgi:hypothetical protein